VVTDLRVEGRDGFDVIRGLVDELGGLEALDPRRHDDLEPFSLLDWGVRNFLKLSMFDRWGVIPAAGDRHLAEFVPSILTEASEWGLDWGVHLTPMAKRVSDQDDFIESVHQQLSGERPLQLWSSAEMMVQVIDSLTTGEHRELPINIPNAGQCPDLPMESVVESMCVVDDTGVRGRDRAATPPPVAELLRRHVATQELTIDAALSGDRQLVRDALALDPLAGRGDLVDLERMADELLAGTARWLPQFAA
jgi:galacturan 1,4-alpha-galacturonidase